MVISFRGPAVSQAGRALALMSLLSAVAADLRQQDKLHVITILLMQRSLFRSHGGFSHKVIPPEGRNIPTER